MARKDWTKVKDFGSQINWVNGKTGDSLFIDKNVHFSDKFEWDIFVIKGGTSVSKRVGIRRKTKKEALRSARAYMRRN